MAWAAIVVGVVSTGVSMYNAKKNRDAAEELSEEALESQRIQQEKLDKQAEEYKALTFENPYENMENAYEDLTVNQQQAQFQAQQGAQQRANIMEGLRGAAGASGIASLAQTMANQGQLMTQRISASIGAQEARNQALMAQGAQTADMAERKGDLMKQKFEADRQATLLGMQMGQTAGTNAAYQAAALNEQQVDAAGRQQVASSLGSLAGTLATADYSSLRTSDPNASGTGGLGSQGGGFSDAGFGYEVSGGIQGPTIDYKGDTQFKQIEPKTYNPQTGLFE